MNQEQVKEKLLKLDPNADDFTVTFSGKSSNKVDGLYYPEKNEILLHTGNFNSENQLIYTAIHEFTHHIQFTNSNVSSRSHTVNFWDLFHNLLNKAEDFGIYQNIFKTDDRFISLTERLKKDFLSINGNLMKELGSLLFEAMSLCHENHVSFEDYVDRELILHRREARTIIKTFTMDINPEIGYDNMKVVARVKDPEIREQVEQAFLKGKTPDMVRAEFSPNIKKIETTSVASLEREKEHIRQTLDKLKKRLVEIETKIEEMKGRSNDEAPEMV